ncbi:hypothetical protein ACIRLA_35960 [Streptomyces sp. NPDC102364]|uniref:hypothetical protein n=1 Tax=Streptomyces sp. NPDC102364 TaxID=3366161 RepID=UPI003814E588
MRTRATISLLATGLVFGSVTGCSASSDNPKPAVTVTKTAPVDSKANGKHDADSAGQDKASSTSSSMRSVQKFSFEGDDEYDPMAGNATVLSYQQPVHASVTAAEEVNEPGYVWAALEVKVCGTKGEFTTSSDPWTLAYKDGTRIEPSGTTYDDFPKPEYVTDAPISAGDCSRGKIVYAVPGKQRPAQALYTTNEEPTLRWSLAK